MQETAPRKVLENVVSVDEVIDLEAETNQAVVPCAPLKVTKSKLAP